jgi:hypothetical protein
VIRFGSPLLGLTVLAQPVGRGPTTGPPLLQTSTASKWPLAAEAGLSWVGVRLAFNV